MTALSLLFGIGLRQKSSENEFLNLIILPERRFKFFDMEYLGMVVCFFIIAIVPLQLYRMDNRDKRLIKLLVVLLLICIVFISLSYLANSLKLLIN